LFCFKLHHYYSRLVGDELKVDRLSKYTTLTSQSPAQNFMRHNYSVTWGSIPTLSLDKLEGYNFQGQSLQCGVVLSFTTRV